MRSVADAMQADLGILFENSTVKFVLRLPIVVKTQADCIKSALHLEMQTPIARSRRASQAPLHFLFVDDQNAARTQAMKLALGMGVDVEAPKWSRDELWGSAFRDEEHFRVWGRSAEEVQMERFIQIVRDWAHVPAIVILDQNLDYIHTIIHGTDICMAMRKAGFTGVVLISSGSDNSDDEQKYLENKADGILRKTSTCTHLLTQLLDWVVVARSRADASGVTSEMLKPEMFIQPNLQELANPTKSVI